MEELSIRITATLVLTIIYLEIIQHLLEHPFIINTNI
jgi:hypothetical protein